MSGALRSGEYSLLHYTGLINAAQGDEDRALIFCGSNACRAEKIETVEEVMRDLCCGA